jgi:membrane protein required for colicin V production
MDEQNLTNQGPLVPLSRIGSRREGMNWLDYAIIVIVGFGVLHGLSRGVLRMLTAILSFALGIDGALAWHGRAEGMVQFHLGTSPASSEIIAYVAIFLLIFVAVEIVGQRLIAFAQLFHLNLLDRLAGAALGGALATIFAAFDIVLLTAIVPPNYPLLQNSTLAPEVDYYNRMLLGYVPPQVRKLYETKRDELVNYWNAKRNNPATAPIQRDSGVATNQ